MRWLGQMLGRPQQLQTVPAKKEAPAMEILARDTAGNVREVANIVGGNLAYSLNR